MGLNVSNFSQLAQTGGTAKLDTMTGNVTTTGTTFLGKVANWFNAKLHPGTVAQENRSVMFQFLNAIAKDPLFGPDFANLATNSLSRTIEQGKPLTARRINETVQEMKAFRESNLALGRSHAQALTEGGAHSSVPYSMGACIQGFMLDNNMTEDISKLDTSRLQSNIKNAITDAGQNGRKTVTLIEAREIVRSETEKFMNAKLALFQGIDGGSFSPQEKTALKELAFEQPHISKLSYLQNAMALKNDAQTLIRTVSAPGCTRAQAIQALETFQQAYGAVFGPMRDGATGADDVVRFAGDVMSLGMKLAGVGQEDKQRLFALMTGDGMKELRESFGFLSIAVSEQPHGPEMVSHMGRIQEFVSELGMETGLSLGMKRDAVFAIQDKNLPVVNSFARIGSDIRSFVEGLGATIPSGVNEVVTSFQGELQSTTEDTVLRTNNDTTRLIASFMKSHGDTIRQHVTTALEQTMKTGKTGTEAYQDFMTRFFGGTTAQDGVRVAQSLPAPVRELARQLFAHGSMAMSDAVGTRSVNASVVLRGIVPAIIDYTILHPESKDTTVLIGNLVQSQASGGVHHGNPEYTVAMQPFVPAMNAFMQELCKQ